jgi:DMSO/TMAO reductase YedYZ heme-binding membrane subunit
VRRLIDPARWKRVQTLAYPFFLLIFIHLVLILLPTAAGSATVIVNLIVYTALFGSYSILRLRRARNDRQTSPELTVAR